MREMNQQAKKKNGSKQGENSLGMFVSLMTSSITTTMPNMSKRITSTVVSAVASMLDETPTMMTTFIRQQINLGTHDIMYQLLAKIVKPMVCNKMQQSKELEVRMMHVGENSALLVLRNQEVSNQNGGSTRRRKTSRGGVTLSFEAQDPLEEVNLGTNDEPRMTKNASVVGRGDESCFSIVVLNYILLMLTLLQLHSDVDSATTSF
ncbi:hypothetical protein GmHk_04G010918 [Glycine max]|nr:hypothetical protein GmHk_04G010918 [Glycine max]